VRLSAMEHLKVDRRAHTTSPRSLLKVPSPDQFCLADYPAYQGAGRPVVFLRLENP
jgi:hypothetical protein